MRAQSALAAIPRTLRLSPSTPVTQSHLVSLYREQLRISHAFPSYNFREFFIRKTRDKFRNELPALLDAAYAPSSSSSSSASSLPSTSHLATSPSPTESPTESDSIYAPSGTPEVAKVASGTTPDARLREWYAEALADLGVMYRSAIVNRLYEAPRLVIELPTRSGPAIVGGGGAGAEASYGGGGQPADGKP